MEVLTCFQTDQKETNTNISSPASKMLLSISVSNDSLSIGEEPPKKSTPKWAYAVIIGIAVVLGVSGYILSLDFTKNSVMANEQPNCQFYIDEAKKLVEKNNGTNYDTWSTEDHAKVLELDALYILNCEPTIVDIMENLDHCVILLITIQSLIDKMIDRNLGSLSEKEQRVYNDTYETYFDQKCNRIIPEIEQTEKFQNFNKTRGES